MESPSINNFELQELPLEVLEPILSFLNWTDLSTLLQVSQSLNKTISDSTRLLEIVRFNYSERSNASSRLYSRFYLTECKNKHLKDFMKNFSHCQTNIKEIRMHCYYPVKMSILSELFCWCKNLKRLEVIGNFMLVKSPISIDDSDDDEEMEVDEVVIEKSTLNLKYLSIDHYHQNFEIIEKCNVKHLHVKRKEDPAQLVKFLKTQKNLETLDLEFFTSFDDLINEEFKFKVKTLILRDVNCEDVKSFIAFLETHENTLKDVIIHGSMSADQFIALQDHPTFNLELNLSTSINNAANFPTMLNVENLEIKCGSVKFDYEVFDGKFPNLRKLRLVDFKNLAPKTSFDNLEELSIESSALRGPLLIPNVKKLKFIDTAFQMTKNPFDFDNNKIEEIFLEYSFFTGWFLSFLQHEDTNLKMVTYRPPSYVDLKMKVIDENRHKIKILKITHPLLLTTQKSLIKLKKLY